MPSMTSMQQGGHISRPFSTLHKALLVGAVLLLVAGVYVVASGRASTLLGVTLTSNSVLNDGLMAHWTLDGTDVLFASSTAEIQDASGNGRHLNLLKVNATTTPTDLSTIATENARAYGTSPTVVFVDENQGYVFFNATSTGATSYGCYYTKTKDGGQTWSARALIDSGTNLSTVCTRIAVWYDKWTPGDTGSLIHIALTDSTSDDISYIQWNTQTDATSSPAITAAVAPSLGNTNYVSITKSTTGVLYVAGHDATIAGVVFTSCSTTCTVGGNWTARAAWVPNGPGDDWPILMPVAGSSSVVQILGDQSANALYARTYDAGSNAWGATSTIGTTLAWNTTQRAGISATLNPTTGTIYLAYVRDNSAYGTNDDFSTARYDPTTNSWTATTDILTNSARGLTNVRLSYDPVEERVYAIYWNRLTAGTANTNVIYRKTSDDHMATWSAEEGPYNASNNEKLGGNVNIISYGRIYAWWKQVSGAITPLTQGNTIALRQPRNLTEGAVGGSMLFDGLDDYAATTTGHAYTGIRTIAFWAFFPNTTASVKLMNIDGTDQIETNGSSDIVATSFPSATVYVNGSAASANIPRAGEWRHIVVTDSTGVNATRLELARVGSTYGAVELDDVRLYSRTLSAEEILRLYQLGATTRIGTTITTNPDLANGLVGHWTFDGRDMFINTGDGGGGGWDLSTASYDSVSKSVNAQDTNPTGIAFKSDGTKMYVVGYANIAVFQYSLSSPWDLSTATYDSVSLDLSGEDSFPYGIAFKSDGTKMYMVGNSNDRVFEYSLSSPWDLSTASYSSVNLSVNAQDTDPFFVSFKSDGTKMYVSGSANNSIYQYTLSPAWENISGASYDSVSKSVTAQDGSPTGVTFKSDGTKMYVVGDINNTVYQYSLSSAWDLSTATYDSVSKSIGAQDTSVYGIAFSSDDTTMYVVGNSNNSVYQYSLDAGSSGDPSSSIARDRSSYANDGAWLNHATTTALGTLGQALVFDGVDDYISVDDGAELGGMAAVTVSAWANASQLGSEIGLGNLAVKLHSVAPDYSYQLYMQADNKFAFEVNNSSSVNGYVVAPSAARKNEWYHVVGVWSAGTSPKLYINGVEVSSGQVGAPGGTLLDSDDILSIGGSKANEEWGGMIDDVRIYNRALSQAEITRLYQLGATTRIGSTITTKSGLSGLVGHWTFDGPHVDITSSTAEILDRSGNSRHGNWDYTGHTSTTVPGIFGQAIHLTVDAGNKDDVTITDHDAFSAVTTGAITVSAWARIEDLTAPNGAFAQQVVNKGAGGGGNYEWALLFDSGDANMAWEMSAVTGAQYCIASTTSAVGYAKVGTWYHMVGVYDGTSCLLYVNGTQIGVDTTFVNVLGNGTANVRIGERADSTNNFEGDVDDVRIFNRALSPAEVRQLYEAGS